MNVDLRRKIAARATRVLRMRHTERDVIVYDAARADLVALLTPEVVIALVRGCDERDALQGENEVLYETLAHANEAMRHGNEALKGEAAKLAAEVEKRRRRE